MCDVSKKKTVVLYHVQYVYTAKGLINHFKQLITHFLCEQVCEKLLCSHKLGTSINLSNSTWFISINYRGLKSLFKEVHVLKMGSSLSERFGLFIQKVYGYCGDLS